MMRRPKSSRGIVGALLFAAWFAPGVLASETPGTIESTPLAGPGPTPGPTMFARLAPADTGIQTENRYADPKMWSSRYQEFLFGAIGTGVAIGDYDGDGRPDIFVVSKTESCRLFRNLGNWKFEDVTERAGVADQGDDAAIWKEGATFVDINNDGRLDLYVCRFNAPNLLYVNQGEGRFKEMAHAYGLDIQDACGMASFADYDRDGWLDVYIATNLLDGAKHPNGQRGYLLHNDRDGTFSNVTERAGISGESSSHSATWWDYDNDGWPDLYVANDYGVPDKLYHNNRDATFTDTLASVAPHTSFSSMGADIGDVNNDGLIDFLVADMAATTHEKDQRGEADLRGRNTDPPENSTGGLKYRRNALLLNTAAGPCLEAACLAGIAATDWTWSVRFEDLDNDGRLDLFVTNGMNREQNIDVNTRMMQAETTAARVKIMHDSPVLAENNLAFRNVGQLAFTNVSAAWGLDEKGVSFGAAFGDLDGDGDLDLVYSNYQQGVAVLRNDSPAGHRVIVDLRGTTSNRFGIGAKVDIETASGRQARQLWLARGYMSSSEPNLHFGLGTDTTIKRMAVTWPSGLLQVFENLPADQRIVVTEPGAPALRRQSASVPSGQFVETAASLGLAVTTRDEPFDEMAQQRLLPTRLNRRGPAVAIGDITGRGTDAVMVAGTTVQPVQILRRGTDGHFAAGEIPAAASGNAVDDGPVLLFDADGDGRNDLLVTKGGNSLPAGSPEYQPKLFLNDGHGAFHTAGDGALPPLLTSVGAAVAADFNHDGKLDVFLGARVLPGQYPTAPISGLLINRGGKFEDVTDRVAPGLREVGMVTAALWSDVDDDGWPDLLLTLEWGGVKYFHNNRGTNFEDWSEKAGFATAGAGWWTSIAAADFNGDGRMDYVVGNVGLNTPYQASRDQPALLFSGDFKGDGLSQLIEAYYENGKLFPRRSRRELSGVLPAVGKRYQRNDYYARATLGEIVGEDKLAKADRFTATEFRSGVFLSQPDGARVSFLFEPLPRLAQIAPLQGIVAGDFDGDGHADIYAVQNSFAPSPVVGRFDGGLSLLLRGDGHGRFTPAWPQESGLVVTGDAKALALIDLDQDGWPDFFVTRNNGSSLAFHNRGVMGRNSFSIRLQGPAGNPTAAGTRIGVEMADGSIQTSEVAIGSGYYSQSTAAVFFGYTGSNPPKQIRVRWPSGATTTHTVPANPTALTLTAPGP